MTSIETLVDRTRVRAHRASRAHYLAAKRAGAMHTRIGVPVVVFSAVTGTTIFATLQETSSLLWSVIAGSISVLAAILAALQTFLDYSGQAEKHRVSGSAYAEKRRELDLLIARTDFDLSEKTRRYEEIVMQINALERDSIDVADKFYDQARSEQDDDKEGV